MKERGSTYEAATAANNALKQTGFKEFVALVLEDLSLRSNVSHAGSAEERGE